MKHLPHFFHKHQLTHLFICFPDPHFKARKHKARIVSQQLNAEYAYAVKPGGMVYTITDVEEVALWMVRCFSGKTKDGQVEDGVSVEREHEDRDQDQPGYRDGYGRGGVEELWQRVSEEEVRTDPCVRIMREETEEGKKVSRNGGNKYVSVWRRRREDPKWPGED